MLLRRDDGRGWTTANVRVVGALQSTVWPLINSHPPDQGAQCPSSKVDEVHERESDLLRGGGGARSTSTVDAQPPPRPTGNNPGENFIIPALIIQPVSL